VVEMGCYVGGLYVNIEKKEKKISREKEKVK
jgi:hypothetical protein